jgi:hypothetical protein
LTFEVRGHALWFDYEEVVIGTDAVSSAINRLGDFLRAGLPGALTALVA